jgi:hypothetical protein
MQDPSNLFLVAEEVQEQIPEIISSNGNGHEIATFAMPLDVEVKAPAIPTGGISPIPIPIPVAKKRSSGRYIGTSGGYRMELRVDVDGSRPCNRISGDYYAVSGSVTTYFGSFKSGAVAIVWTDTLVTITGTVTTTWSTSYTKFKITIPRVSILSITNPAATITWYNASNVAGATYVCAYNSPYFRTLAFEMDYEAGATLFGSYDTNSMPHGGVGRVLNTISAYAEAGIQLNQTAATDAIAHNEAGADTKWTDAELETAMHHHFSIIQDAPVWQTYLMGMTSSYLSQPGWVTFGIMFDYSGASQRQGCAVFQTDVNNYYGGAGTNNANRHMLYTYVHELGHSFNLLHSWDKGRPSSLSWMNYDWKYDAINGAGSFWLNFAFQFDDQELIHIRHGYRNNVIQGGDNWAVNAGEMAPEELPKAIPDVIDNNSGLNLTIKAKDTYYLGEPVVLEIALRLRDLNGKKVHSALHPNMDLTKVAIRKPNGNVVTYEGCAERFGVPQIASLTEDNPSIYDSAYIGYGKDGFYFDQPGFYLIKAAYRTAEGGVITSNEIRVRVKYPVTEADENIAALYMGEEQGKLFYLLGSDGEHLQAGNDALRTVLERYPKHQLSSYAALVLGVNASRDFKTVHSNRTVTVRSADPMTTGDFISKVFDAARKGEGVDNITLNFALRRKAVAEIKAGQPDTAKNTLEDMRKFFEKKNLKRHVMHHIDAQIAATMAIAEG